MTTFAARMVRRDSRVVRQVRRDMIAIACIDMIPFWWSIYGRVWHIMRIELRPAALVLVPGSTVGYDIAVSRECATVSASNSYKARSVRKIVRLPQLALDRRRTLASSRTVQTSRRFIATRRRFDARASSHPADAR